MRGNRAPSATPAAAGRSIPAYAGEPWGGQWSWAVNWVYPRVCGGTCKRRPRPAWRRGLSPRMRGNPPKGRIPADARRSIPAYAGEPGVRFRPNRALRVYPRVCGGTCPPRNVCGLDDGLSPRMRGNPRAILARRGWRRSIPAYAGEPDMACLARRRSRVYPRVCGGTWQTEFVESRPEGLSPRMRGNRRCARPRAYQ